MVCGNRPTAYSFRHSFIDEMKQHGAEESVVAQIVGHEPANITLGRYGKKYPVKLLRKKIQQVKYGLEDIGMVNGADVVR